MGNRILFLRQFDRELLLHCLCFPDWKEKSWLKTEYLNRQHNILIQYYSIFLAFQESLNLFIMQEVTRRHRQVIPVTFYATEYQKENIYKSRKSFLILELSYTSFVGKQMYMHNWSYMAIHRNTNSYLPTTSPHSEQIISPAL